MNEEMQEQLQQWGKDISPKPTLGKLAAALAKAQSEYGQVPKSRTATVKTKTGGEYSYNYADLNDVMSMARPILAKHGLAFSQLFKKVDGKLRLISKLMLADTEETLESDGIAISEGLLPQEFGSYHTYWRKYDACGLLGISAEDDDDAQKAQRAAKKPKVADEDRALERIAPFQVRAFNSACQQFGKPDKQVAEYLTSLGYNGIEEVTKADFNIVIKWASAAERGGAVRVSDQSAPHENIEKAERNKRQAFNESLTNLSK